MFTNLCLGNSDKHARVLTRELAVLDAEDASPHRAGYTAVAARDTGSLLKWPRRSFYEHASSRRGVTIHLLQQPRQLCDGRWQGISFCSSAAL